MKKIYQIVYRGIYDNKLSIMETTSVSEFKDTVEMFKNGKFENLNLIDTNIGTEW